MATEPALGVALLGTVGPGSLLHPTLWIKLFRWRDSTDAVKLVVGQLGGGTGDGVISGFGSEQFGGLPREFGVFRE